MMSLIYLSYVRIDRKKRYPENGFFLFLTFFNNILISIRIGFYLQEVACLVAPLSPARQIASVASVHVARQSGHAGGPSQRCATSAMTWTSLSRQMHWHDYVLVFISLPPGGLARQGQCPGPAAAPSPLPSLSFPPPPRPVLQAGRRRRPPPPKIAPKFGFFEGKKCGESFPILVRRYCP